MRLYWMHNLMYSDFLPNPKRNMWSRVNFTRTSRNGESLEKGNQSSLEEGLSEAQHQDCDDYSMRFWKLANS